MKRTKLDDKSEKLVFVGYNSKSKGYKPGSKKTIVSRDVKFDEDDFWNWENQDDDYNFFPLFDDKIWS